MRKLVLLFGFLMFSLSGFCDTLDYWHVYVNHKLIAKFNENSKDLTITIKKSEIKKNDSITVRYGTDHSCSDCYYALVVIADFKRKAPEAETKGNFGKLTIALKELLDIQKTDGTTRFYFNYCERKKTVRDENERMLFELTIL